MYILALKQYNINFSYIKYRPGVQYKEVNAAQTV